MRGLGGLGHLEAVVMDRLWARADPATVREVRDELEKSQQTRPLAYTTVLTVMDNLYRKGFLTRQPNGRAHSYRPVKSRSEYAAELMEEALADSGDRTAALLQFVEAIPPDEAESLRIALAGNGAATHSDPRRAKRAKRAQDDHGTPPHGQQPRGEIR